MISNVDPVELVEPTQSWVSAQKQGVAASRPNIIKQYNTFMGGVVRMDQNTYSYRVGIRSKKWWWPVFMFCVDTGVHNAWQLYRKSPQEKDCRWSILPLLYVLTRNH